jgi:ribonuclease HI/ADP-ribose pyrophosphatase YjhB (NUDIX family)
MVDTWYKKTERTRIMKQRVVVQAIIEDKDKTLFIRRSQGRPGIIGKFELPGGTLEDNEQPEDALRRHLTSALGIVADIMTLRDVMSMTNREDGDVQHIFIVYVVQGDTTNVRVQPGRSYDKYEWKKLLEIQQSELRDSAIYLLNLDVVKNTKVNVTQYKASNEVNKATKAIPIVIYSDGGSRGNPGPSAAAFVMVDGATVIDQGGEYLGITTNNQAEYHGVQLGLEKAIDRELRSIEFRIDSMLVVNQLNGLYKIKNRELWPINERIEMLLRQFDSVIFKHIPRELNTLADALVNKVLDEHE